jgi:hypothetical protein
MNCDMKQTEELGQASGRARCSTGDRIEEDPEELELLRRAEGFVRRHGEPEFGEGSEAGIHHRTTLGFGVRNDKEIIAITCVYNAALTKNPADNRHHDLAPIRRGRETEYEAAKTEV